MKLIPMDALDKKSIPYSRAHLYRLIRAKKFPAPVRLGENRIAFLESEIDDWLKEKIAARDADAEVA
jgi:prophage regulatory protein